MSSRLPSPSSACKKRDAESASYFSSLAVEPLVSTSSDDGERLLGLVLEDRDLLLDAVVVDFEVVFVERADELAGLRS